MHRIGRPQPGCEDLLMNARRMFFGKTYDVRVTGVSTTTLLDGRGGSARKLREGEEVLDEGCALE
jgi:hypothetical protein